MNLTSEEDRGASSLLAKIPGRHVKSILKHELKTVGEKKSV